MLAFFRHLLTPHTTNNHRAKILHNSSLLLIIIFLLVGSLLINIVSTSKPQVLGVSYSISESDLLTLVNEKRQEGGLAALSLNSQLEDAARRKASDMFSKNYWAHFAPDGSTTPWMFIKSAGYNYSYAGENLAKGFTDANSIVEAWMNSPTHRENIMSDKYSDIGFAIVPGTLSGEDTVLVVQMFGSRSESEAAVVPQVAAESVATKIAGSQILPNNLMGTQSAAITHPKIDTQITSKAASTVGLSFLAFVFVMDLLIVERKKIPRIVGHNIDHVILILLFLLFIILRTTGVIL